MEDSLEIKNSNADVEEPIKSEAPVQNSDSSERSEGAASPPPNCSICLGKLVNTSFTDSCLHQFCFTCLLQWSKIKTECPLCKQTFKSIIHNVRSEEDYDQYHVPHELASQISQPQVTATLDVNFDVDGNWDIAPRRFVYRTTMTGNRRHGTILNPEQVARQEQIPSIASQLSREEHRHRRNNPTEYRRNVYRHGMWATALSDMFGNFRECSPEFYRRQPQEIDRLIPWLNRELQVLLNDEPSHIAYFLGIIIDALTQYDIRSPEFRNVVRPFFTVHTDHFAHELFNFAQTNLDLFGYDRYVTYLPRGLSNEYTNHIVSPTSYTSTTSNSTSTSSSSSSSSISITSDHSDIRILDEAMDLRVNVEIPSTHPVSHSINIPGPSTVGQLFRRVESYNVPELLILSSTTSESDGECEIIGYVKPRHERTPEIIEILSSDPEDIVIRDASTVPAAQSIQRETCSENSVLPSTSYDVRSSLSSSSTISSDNNSDNDYNPKQNKYLKKSSSKKTTTQKHKRSYATKKRKRSRRRSSSSDSSSSENSLIEKYKKRTKKTKYIHKVQNKALEIKLKKEENYLDDYFSNSSSTETDSKTKTGKSHRQHRSKRKCSFSSSDRTAKSERTTRSKERASVLEKLKSRNKDQKYCENRQSRSRSGSKSSNVSDRDKRLSYKHRDLRDTSDYGNRNDSASMNKDTSRKEHRSKSKRKEHYSSDTEDDRLRSSSQCSNHSSKSYSQWRKSKHKERKCKDKERHNSNSKTLNLSQSNEDMPLTVLASPRNDTYPTKHSERSDSNYKEKYKLLHKRDHRESKHKKSENEKKSRPKKKSKRLQSSSTSNSE